MNFVPHIILIPLLAALIGWITNVVAIKMLFHPRKPLRLGFMTLHGIFPKRQQIFAEKLGGIIANDLLSNEEIKTQLEKLADNPEFREELTLRIKDLLLKKLPSAVPMLAMFINEDLVTSILSQIKGDIGGMLKGLVDSLANKLNTHLDIRTLVETKVKAYSSDRLEDLILGIMKREFREVELLGGVLGFLIGLVQVLIV